MLGIRVDGNAKIATGHIMRCLSIASAARNTNTDVSFIVADNESETLLSDSDFPIIVLHTEWNNLESELPKIQSIIHDNNIDKIIVDSYYVTEKYLEELETVSSTVYIDDLFEIHPNISAIINYAIYGLHLPYLKNNSTEKTKLLLGPNYVPLRAEFQKISPVFRDTISKILITAGGADTYNAAGKIVSAALQDSFFDGIEFHVVAGKLNSNLLLLNELALKHANVTIHQDVRNMAELMLASDIAVTAGGSTIYELSACGLPSISFSWADNQLMNVKTFADQKIIEYAGDIRTNSEKCIATIISLLKKYISNTELRRKCSERMRTVTDGNGALRIAEEIMNL